MRSVRFVLQCAEISTPGMSMRNSYLLPMQSFIFANNYKS
jgi:hypothetical protein